MASSTINKERIQILKVINPGSYWVKFCESLSLTKLSCYIEETLTKVQTAEFSPKTVSPAVFFIGVISCPSEMIQKYL